MLADNCLMVQLTVQRWNRYGKSRLYVNDESGGRVGWYDLETGVPTLERSELADAFATALAPHIDGEAELTVVADVVEQQTPTRESEPLPEPAEPTGDLALRRPGQGVREKAEQEWRASRESSALRAYAGRLLDAKTDERAWRRGAEGEELIGKRAGRLASRGWHALHSVPVGIGQSDIDHVLIGPGGVFTVNTKNHLGQRVSATSRGIWVGGYRQDYVRNSIHEAKRATRLLSYACDFPVFARGLIVVIADRFSVREQPDEVVVLRSGDLVKWLKKRPTVLEAATVDTIYQAARREDVWRSQDG